MKNNEANDPLRGLGPYAGVEFGLKPSDLRLGVPVPFVGLLGKTEKEATLGLVVRALVVRGDTWRPFALREVRELLLTGEDPYAVRLASNPFLGVDVVGLLVWGLADLEPREEYTGQPLGPDKVLALRASVIEDLVAYERKRRAVQAAAL